MVLSAEEKQLRKEFKELRKQKMKDTLRKQRIKDMAEIKKIIGKKKQTRIKKSIKKKVGRDPTSIIESFRPTKTNINKEINRLRKQIRREIGQKDTEPLRLDIEELRRQLAALN